MGTAFGDVRHERWVHIAFGVNRGKAVIFLDGIVEASNDNLPFNRVTSGKRR